MSLLAQLEQTLQAQKLVAPGQTLVVAVSGGPDSLALLDALRALAPRWGLTLQVAHLNHQLRGEASDADEQFVLQTAKEWGLPAASARWDVSEYARENRLSVEQAARDLRYRFLIGVAAQVGANAIATAHTADDQVETILLHFLRGSGLAGLRGMAYANELTTADGRRATVIRPLLDVTRSQVEEYCAEHALQPRVDESNFDTGILRNRLRHDVLPYLESINPNLRAVLRHSARAIADDYAYIQQNVLGIFDRMTRPIEGGFVFDRKWFRALPVNLQRGVLREAVTRLGRLKNVGYTHLETARRAAAERDAGAQAILPQGLRLVVGYDDFTVGEQLPWPDAPLLSHGETLPLKPGDERLLPESDWAIRILERDLRSADSQPTESRPNRSVWRAAFDADAVRGPLVLRTRRRGEKFCPAGMGGKHKSLHEFMMDAKIPRHLRDRIPILADDEQVLWVCGYRTDERARVTEATKRMLDVEFVQTR